MYKINSKRISDFFFNLFLIIFILLFNKNNIAYASNTNWLEVSENKFGRQYWDKDSLIYKDNKTIEITTKYLKIDEKNPNKIENNIYTMQINCLTNEYKDISINGKKNLNPKWDSQNGDKLINDVISDSCKNA